MSEPAEAAKGVDLTADLALSQSANISGQRSGTHSVREKGGAHPEKHFEGTNLLSA